MIEQKHKKSALWLPRSTNRPIQVLMRDGTGKKPRTYICHQPLRLGYCDECELHLKGDHGPDVLFELNRVDEPFRLTTPLSADELSRRVDLLVNGQPLRGPTCELDAGSRVEIVDKANNERYSLVVEPRRFWLFRPRALSATILLVAIVGALSGAYLFWTLRGTQTELTRAEERLVHAETEMERTERRLQQAVDRIETAESRLVETVEEFRAAQTAAENAIRQEFDQRLGDIGKRARQALAEFSEQDVEARRQLEFSTQEDITALRRELSGEMVASYQRFKGLEERLFAALAEQLEPRELEGERFKRILAASRQALIFINTTYQVEALGSGEISQYSSSGSGFFVAPRGLAVTAQHVLYPWRYERQFIVLEQLGLVRVVADSVRWSVWLTGETVMEETDGAPRLVVDTAYQSGREDRAVHLLYVPTIAVSDVTISSPAGLITVRSPRAGPTDLAVIRLLDFSRQFEFLALTEAPQAIEPLDDVLAIGYPYSRLEDGVATPQAARGFVRRVSREVMELDTPMHPGLSGGPILNRDGRVIGMAVGFVGSDVFGMAVRSEDLQQALQSAERSVRADQQRLAAIGCDPGPVSGRIDAATWQAYRCERRLRAKAPSTRD